MSAAEMDGVTTLETDMLVLGAGPGGYSAAFRCADLGMKTMLLERYPSLGGVCLNVGCIPSKTLLHVGAVIEDAQRAEVAGIRFASPEIDVNKLRAHKAKIVSQLTSGLAAMAKGRQVSVVRGEGQFLNDHEICAYETAGEGAQKTGKTSHIRFRQCIIAAGSSPVHLPFLPQDPRIMDSTAALGLPEHCANLLVIGGGIIGLEMATIYASLGSQVDIVEMLDDVMPGPDRDLVKIWSQRNTHRFENLMLKTKTKYVNAKDDGLWVDFEGDMAPPDAQRYDLILQATGRTPNGHRIGADKAGIDVDERGFIRVDRQMRTAVPHIFAIGDIAGGPMLAHKAVHEAHVAAEAAAGGKRCFDALTIPAVAYTHPEVAWVGLGEDEARQQGRSVDVARFPWAASGRAIANGADYGLTKLIFDAQTHRLVGGGMVGVSAGDMIGEIGLGIEMGCDAHDIGQTIHPHPTLGETIGLAAEVACGCCTDLPTQRRRR
jgi:dihydrolipoamide dehydrogenase